jgi:hypothetical protein
MDRFENIRYANYPVRVVREIVGVKEISLNKISDTHVIKKIKCLTIVFVPKI